MDVPNNQIFQTLGTINFRLQSITRNDGEKNYQIWKHDRLLRFWGVV